MTDFNRRDMFKFGGAGLLAGGALSPILSPLNAMARSPRAAASSDKVFTIFLRGGMDGLHTVVPVGDTTYQGVRGGAGALLNLADDINETVPLLGTSFARLNKTFRKLAETPGTADQNGHVAWILNCGNPDGRRSHFNEQQVWETGYAPPTTADPYVDEGMLARLAAAAPFGGNLPAASVSTRMQQSFRSTETTLAHVKSLKSYTFGKDDSVNDNLGDRQEDGLAGHAGQGGPSVLERYVDDTNLFVRDSVQEVDNVKNNGLGLPGSLFPATSSDAALAGMTNTQYPRGFGFMRQCRDALDLLLRAPGCQCVGVELGAWDTHVNQSTQRPDLDEYLAQAVASIYRVATSGGHPNVTILVVTDFGRTTHVNASGNGTDHGLGGLMMAIGPKVNGGVYNCHNGGGLGAPWVDLEPGDPNVINAQPVKTDFRRVYAELFEKRFMLTSGVNGTISTVIPGWTDPNYLGVFQP